MRRHADISAGLVVGALVGWCTGVLHAQPLHLNLEASYGPFRAAATSGGVGSILCLGDSLTFRAGGFFEAFQPMVQGAYGDAGSGYQGMSLWTGATNFDSWEWMQGRINTDLFPHRSLDGLWMSAFPWENTVATFALRDRFARVHYAVEPSAGSFTVLVPGEEPYTIEAVGANQLGVIEAAFDLEEAREVRFFAHASGAVTILGAENRNGQAGALVHRAANGGWGLPEFLRRDWTFDAQVAQLRPELTIIMLGQNDPDFGYASYLIGMGALVDRVRAAWPAGRIVLVSTYDSGSAHLAPLANAMRDVASERGTGFIDLYRAGGRYQYYVNAGMVDADGLHFAPTGGASVARLIFDALETGGASLGNAPCGDVDFNNDGSLFDPDDVDAFLSVFSEGACVPAGATCDEIDFDKDGSRFDPQDIDAFLRVFSEGSCL
jgi:hypothetical protein